MRQARRLVASAEALFASGNYDAALLEFERAHALMGSDPRRHAILNNIAVSHERSFRYGEALRYYHRYLDEAAPDAGDRAEVLAIIRTLENLLGTVVLRVSGAPELWVDGRRVGACPSELKLPAGTRVLELRASGYEPQRHEIVVVARRSTTLDVSLTPISDLGGLPPHFFYIGTALTAAAAVTSTILGVSLLSRHERAKALTEDQGGLRTPAALERQASLEDLERMTDLSLGATAVLGTATIVLLIMTRWGLPAEEGTRTSAVPLLVRGGGGLAVQGVLP